VPKLVWIFALVAAGLGAEPSVRVAGDPVYTHHLNLIGDTATVSWSADGSGGLSVAVSAVTEGWVGIGLGSQVMAGAWIFMGYVKDGQGVFSEQRGEGHSHHPVAEPRADRWSVTRQGARTVVSFHLPPGRVPLPGPEIPFITAYAGAPDLTTFHEDTLDGGVITLD